MQKYDDDLSPDVRFYIASLRSADARDRARDYARMDAMSFQARFGPAVDELDEAIASMQSDVTSSKLDLAELLEIVKRKPDLGYGPLTRVAIWIEASTPRMLSLIAGSLLVLLFYIIEQIGK